MNKVYVTERGDASFHIDLIAKTIEKSKVIAISKNPSKFLELLDKTHIDLHKNLILHCTITGFGGTSLEPKVSSPDLALTSYKEICDRYKNEGLSLDYVVLRVDPIVPNQEGFDISLEIIKQRYYLDSRVRISFLDFYRHVFERFDKNDIKVSDIKFDGIHADLEIRKHYYDLLKNECKNLEICGEPGLPCTGCVSIKDIKLFDLEESIQKNNKQRTYCSCLTEKIELLKEKKKCPNNCLYCYWKD